ncbi:hypothetical protein SUDANB105_04440 [Streptomyces sp. enrichment culture]
MKRLGVAFLDAVDGEPRSDPHAHVAGPDLRDHRFDDLHHEPDPPGDRTAVLVGAAVGVPGEELVQQTAVRGVHLDALEPGVERAPGGGREAGDGGADVVAGHLAGHDGRPVPFRGEDRAGQRDRRGGERYVAAGRGVADPAAVLELEEHPPARVPHRVGDPPPAGPVRRGVDGGDVRVGLPDRVGRRGLGDDQAGGGALGDVR